MLYQGAGFIAPTRLRPEAHPLFAWPGGSLAPELVTVRHDNAREAGWTRQPAGRPGLGATAEERVAEFRGRVVRDLGRLSAIGTLAAEPAEVGVLGTDEELLAAWRQAVRTEVQSISGDLETEGARAAAERIYRALSGEGDLESARAFLLDRIEEQRYLVQSPEEKTLVQSIATSTVGGAAAKITMFIGATFSEATGFHRGEIERALASAAGRDAETVTEGRALGRGLGLGAILLAALLAAIYFGTRAGR